ncbi:DUF2254 domain-containing protein [Methylobacterium sp. E-005]|uniref:DUF2254 family protein n=1 Tax=Methylobacterium sp. E-005 TaxID=2836549 RepID=UPI001FB98FB8|nr:DUF2254 family protein [Methylobacterium sp. E-005]MCJ2090091.1 DUF2254 domain-containing protein [Methylobacterium sp. E-005]
MNIVDQVGDRVLALIRRSLREFIGLPLIVVAVFLGLFALSYLLDDALWDRSGPTPVPWLSHLLGDTSAIASLLGTVASGMITVTSITFSLLLIAVQQTASTLSTHVYDQFIQRRSNKLSFGFFVGLSVFVLLTLGSANPDHKPIIGALLSLLMTGAALCMVVILIYSTIDQMRPHAVITAIHDHTMKARVVDGRMIAGTRQFPRAGLSWSQVVRTDAYGVVCGLDLPTIERSAAEQSADIEIIGRVGTNVAFRDPLFRIHAARAPSADALMNLKRSVTEAIKIEPRRTIDSDAGFGIEQLYSIAWTTASTSKQNPQPAILVCHCLRDIIARWSSADKILENSASRVAYADRGVDDAIQAIAAIGVVASESMQNMLAAEVWRTLATLIDDVPAERLPALTDTVRRLLSSLGDHVLTHDLEGELGRCRRSLESRGEPDAAEAIRVAAETLAMSIGTLNARGTRVPTSA